jgi:hypothetical protein
MPQSSCIDQLIINLRKNLEAVNNVTVKIDDLADSYIYLISNFVFYLWRNSFNCNIFRFYKCVTKFKTVCLLNRLRAQ